MKLNIFILLILISLTGFSQNQEGFTGSGLKTRQHPFPTENYTELPNPVATDLQNWNSVKGINIGWGSTDVRYKKEEPANNLEQTKHLRAWRGERISAQIVISNADKDTEISIEISDLKNSRNKIGKEHFESAFVRYVMTDQLNKDGKGGCGYRKSADFDSTLVADVLDHHIKKMEITKHSSRGVWIKLQIPQNTKKGNYKGFVTIKNKTKILKKLPIEVQVLERTLPQPKDWKYHLDLWQNPYAVARYFNVTPWSEAHFEYLKKEMKLYADAGGKSITASIMYEPWGGQTQDAFNSMVMWIRKLDGSWHFDFAIFDKWVEFMHQMGITKQINCYSMVPWKLSFQYFDQATNQLQSIKTQPGESQYEQMWTAMLTAFAKHLKAKGWFEKTFISMDERPKEVMLKTLKIIKNADPNFKISLAGDWHQELEPDLDDYCVPLHTKYEPKILEKRKKQGKVTTYYTCCTEPYPNTFTFSKPAESEWLAWYAAKDNLDGYLRWALNSWTLEPLLDSRFRSWAAGDTYLIYPMGRSSIRLERMLEGIQFYEKVNILREEFQKKQNSEELKKIEKALQLFDEKTLPQHPASEVTKKAREIINSL
ncbi:DUF4091 domain-containing protein [Capnocytophaga felis]|uniref:Uncharacterized protein n=1 Tax=Capnocytophaga felis TaxID=2267611 RepID=A0A5M4B8T3_9FLAO|nr:DUF4091 domain-containing protein [Capnocytophaga felis]GET46023.1 hypothetical protein RCZ01_13250 [Capnocytophaga felis]GET49125.1 hypothetical protein RCZ02_19560 [Capnocytophaga felis]